MPSKMHLEKLNKTLIIEKGYMMGLTQTVWSSRKGKLNPSYTPRTSHNTPTFLKLY